MRRDLSENVKKVEERLLKHAEPGLKYRIRSELNAIARSIKHRPLKPFLWDNGLALAARDHCEDRVKSHNPRSQIGAD